MDEGISYIVKTDKEVLDKYVTLRSVRSCILTLIRNEEWTNGAKTPTVRFVYSTIPSWFISYICFDSRVA